MSKLLLTIVVVNGHNWNEEDGDERKHLHHLF